MGQALNERGEQIAEAFGQTKLEVFEKLIRKAPDAAEMRIMQRHPEGSPPDEDCDQPTINGPCRESCRTILERRISTLRRELTGHEQLLQVVDRLENGSPAEAVLWETLVRRQHLSY